MRDEDSTDPRRLVGFYRDLTEEASQDPDAWIALARSLEMLAWGKDSFDAWPRAPWTGLSKEGAEFLAEGRPVFHEMPMDFVDPDPGEAKFQQEFSEREARMPWEREGLLLGHAIWKEEARIGTIGLKMRATGEQRAQVLEDERMQLVQEAIEAWANGIDCSPRDLPFSLLRDAVYRFKQLAFYDAKSREDSPEQWEMALGRPQPEPPRANNDVDMTGLLETLDASNLPRYHAAALKVDYALERVRPGFNLDGLGDPDQPWEIRGPYIFSPSEEGIPPENPVHSVADSLWCCLCVTAEEATELGVVKIDNNPRHEADATSRNWQQPFLHPASAELGSDLACLLFRRICLLLYLLTLSEIQSGRPSDARQAARLLNAWLESPREEVRAEEDYHLFSDYLTAQAKGVLQNAT